MENKKEKVLERYKDKRKEIQEYMELFINTLEEKYGFISEDYIVSLDLLAFNLEVLFRSIDEMREKGMSEVDKYHGEKKNACMQAFFNSQNYIHKLIASFGFTPMSKSKMKSNTDENDLKKMMEAITDV